MPHLARIIERTQCTENTVLLTSCRLFVGDRPDDLLRVLVADSGGGAYGERQFILTVPGESQALTVKKKNPG